MPARRVDLRDFLPDPIELTMPDGRVYTVPAIGVKTMMELFAIEAALRSDGDDTMGTTMQALADANGKLVEILRETNENVPDYDLPMQATMAMFGVLAGAQSASEEVAQALFAAAQAGAGGDTPLADKTSRKTKPGSKTKSKSSASRKHSPQRSSGSGNGTAGRPNGGSNLAARGRPSRATS